MLDVWDRMTELQFANKTEKDVKLAQTINKLVAVIEKLSEERGEPVLQGDDFRGLAKYKAFDNIIPIVNNSPEPVSSSSDFSRDSIKRRIDAGYRLRRPRWRTRRSLWPSSRLRSERPATVSGGVQRCRMNHDGRACARPSRFQRCYPLLKTRIKSATWCDTGSGIRTQTNLVLATLMSQQSRP